MSSAKTIFKILIPVIVLIVVALFYFYSEREPVISIIDNQVKIKALYGQSIDFSEIAEVSLIDKSIRELGIGARTNGYGGFGGTLKGNFRSKTLGATLLFVQADSSPTIKIERIGKKDIYISLRDGQRTKLLYNDIILNMLLE